jgi:hypothetical protein
MTEDQRIAYNIRHLGLDSAQKFEAHIQKVNGSEEELTARRKMQSEAQLARNAAARK